MYQMRRKQQINKVYMKQEKRTDPEHMTIETISV